jgi:hypothetical protein
LGRVGRVAEGKVASRLELAVPARVKTTGGETRRVIGGKLQKQILTENKEKKYK